MSTDAPGGATGSTTAAITSPDASRIECSVTDGIAVVTIARPEKLNSMTREMEHDLVDTLEQVDLDDAVRVVIVTGSGRAFCAGADLSAGAEQTFDIDRDVQTRARAGLISGVPRDGGGMLALRVAAMRKPVIAAINGPAIGLGITFALPMDVRIAARSARFGFVFSRRGIVTEATSSWFLPRVVGISQAMVWVTTGRIFGAEEALAGRLVSEVVPDDELMPTALALAAEIAECSPISVAISRQLLWSMSAADSPWAAHRLESQLLRTLGQSDDAAEGIRAFLEKRAPNFVTPLSSGLPDYLPSWPGTPPDLQTASTGADT